MGSTTKGVGDLRCPRSFRCGFTRLPSWLNRKRKSISFMIRGSPRFVFALSHPVMFDSAMWISILLDSLSSARVMRNFICAGSSALTGPFSASVARSTVGCSVM